LAKIKENYFSRFHGMSLFQNSILNAYKQDEALIASRWAAYQNFLAKKDAVKAFKEEEYQEGFLKDVFASCLGYTLKTTDPANYNLERETKNETDSKKADGAIYVGGKVTGVIELKAQNTQNLDKATDQAFGYLTKNSHAKYVIVSNFDELRFYVEKATDYEKFHLFSLDYDGFKKLHLILSFESIAKELPHAMKQKSQNFEHEISKQLYKDFSAFRTHLFENIVKNNFTSFGGEVLVSPETNATKVASPTGSEASASPTTDTAEVASPTGSEASASPTTDTAEVASPTESEASASPTTDTAEVASPTGSEALVSPETNATKVASPTGSEASASPTTDTAEVASAIDKTTLLRLTQKLCDRIIFILFAEDRGLLNPNTIKEIRSRHADDIMGNPMYGYYKIYFNAINQGNEKLAIPKYNGGLFAPDALLESLVIDDEVLDMEAQKLSDYDFASDISVNILGHIFEQSLTDLEEMERGFANEDFTVGSEALASPKTSATKVAPPISKRKKDGVFYTPEYITRYIVQNTLGTLCDEKKEALSLGDEALASPINPKKLTKAEEKHKQNILEYRAWLENLKILDPACGSGAFLNQALEFLIAEHTQVRDKLLPFQDLTLNYEIETAILEHNLYGVDINEDAVEIARLSLWLRTARRGRTLTNLSGKIKCGNSLIDDKTVAENAFDWHAEFPEVFAQGGFDVVIGNPPYGAKLDKKQTKYISKHFDDNLSGELETYIAFYYKVNLILKENGYFGYITPDTWLTIQKAKGLRNNFFKNYILIEVYDRYKPFEDAKDTRCHTVIALKGKQNKYSFAVKVVNHRMEIVKDFQFNSSDLDNTAEWNLYVSQKEKKIFDKMKQCTFLEEIVNIKYGLRTGDNAKYLSNKDDNNIGLKIARGSNIERYFFNWNPEYLLSKDGLPNSYFTNAELKEKIILQYVRTNSTDPKSRWLEACLIEDNNFVPLNSTSFLYNKSNTISLKYLLVVLSSHLLNYFYKAHYTDVNVKPLYLAKLPVPGIDQNEQQPFIEKADQMLSLNKQLQETKQNFLNELGLEKLPKKLQNFEELEFDEFVKEYAKAKKIKFADKLAERNFKQEWQAMFEHDKTMACTLKEQIAQTDKAIDAMVYKLYDLSDEEIGIVEGL
jgi:hypothetical protein